MTSSTGRRLHQFARALIGQARMLRDEGMASEADRLMRLSSVYRAIAWRACDRPA